jgi:hypothetical protein
MAEAAKKRDNKLYLANLVMVVLLVGVVVGGILVWRDHLGNRAQVAALNEQIAQVNQKIIDTPAPPADLEAGLASALAGLAAAETALPTAINRNDVVDYIIGLADACRVEAVPLVVEGWVPEGPGSSYSALKLSVTVTGSLSGVTGLISELQDSEYPSLTVTGLSVARLDRPGNSAGFGDDTLVTVDMNIALYTYTPAAPEEISS